MLYRIVLLLVIFSLTSLSAASKKRILILEFDNQQKVKKFDYLRNTIAGTIEERLKRGKKYKVLTLKKLTGKSASETKKLRNVELYKDDIALGLGEEAKADVVIAGNFAFLGKEVLIQAKALDVKRTHTFTTTASRAPTDTGLFDAIGEVAKEITKNVDEKMARWEEEDATVEKAVDRWRADTIYVSANFHYAQPLESFADALAPALYLKAYGAYKLIFFDPVSLNLAGQFGYRNHKENKEFPTTLKYQTISTWGGLEFSYSLLKIPLSFHLNALIGLAFSSADRGLDDTSISSRDQILGTGLELRYAMWRGVTWSVQGSYEKIMFGGPQLAYFTVGSGVGYRF